MEEDYRYVIVCLAYDKYAICYGIQIASIKFDLY